MSEKTSASASRRSVRLASVAAVATIAGLLSGPGSAADDVDASVVVTYDCDLPSGRVQVPLEVRGTFPATGEVDVPMSPLDVRMAADFQATDLAPLLPEGATEVVSTAALDVDVTQNGESAQAQWAQFVAPATNLAGDESGKVRLAHTGEVPSVTVGAGGDVTLIAGGLTLELSTPAVGGEETPADPVTLNCGRSEGDAGVLATVPVQDTGTETPDPGGETDPGEGGGEDPGDPGEEPPAQPPADTSCTEDVPVGEMDSSEAVPPPPGAPPLVLAAAGQKVCGYAVGLASIKKLNGSVIINDPAKKPAMITANANKRVLLRLPTMEGGLYVQYGSIARLELPDAESTFLAFGFQPVSAKVAFESGLLTVSTGQVAPDFLHVAPFAVASFQQSMRLYDVKVNGVPLDVGPDCRTAHPYKVVLRGDFENGNPYLNVLDGGPLNGTLDIPAFSGCGTGGEDLDALFTASISGPGNTIAMNQANMCVPDADLEVRNCPPRIPALPGSPAPAVD
ncbi:hypothetical protein OG233_03250 [Streptomyces sp. NBC_01218]|uniref:DUF6801 domain-containing protein n=1 Tax=unclassified Streptomyces TaxID=2593676 RepID=UPI0023B8C6E7|nr:MULTISPECIES: DUF6801 domain-containing protein [unclassified Streptomyces]WEH38607.1 hypothetical protein PZB77_03295 [Streptomyces sp. AM 2-1-1]WSQ50266.1 hypothetical protein OG233_03250 [Streptomyces sp. NBC_01218]